MTITDDCLRNNAGYAEGFSLGDLPITPAKRIAIVACMDARLKIGAMLGLAEGDAHVIRNAGGVVTDDVIRSLIISQRLLGTREIVLIHHSDCGMLTFRDDDLKDAVEQDAGIRPAFAMEAFPTSRTTSVNRWRESRKAPLSPTRIGFEVLSTRWRPDSCGK